MKQSIESINQILNEYKTQRELLKQELDSIDEMMTFWVKKREEIRDRIEGNNPTDPDLFREMFGPGATPTVPEVSYTYTDTPMAEEYYGGWHSRLHIVGHSKV